MLFNTDDPSSEAEARRALELNPSLPDPHNMLFELRHSKETKERWSGRSRQHTALTPSGPTSSGFWERYISMTGREQEALEHWKKTEQLAPAAYRGMTEYYLIKGDFEKAKEFHAKAEKLEPTRPWLIWMGGVIAAMEGDRERALLAVKKIEDAKMGPIGFNYIGYVYYALGDLDSFFEYMNRALETHALIP